MKPSIAIAAALVATAMGVGSALPAFADDATQTDGAGNQFHLQLDGSSTSMGLGGRNGMGMGPGRGMGMGMGPGMGRGILALACSPHGAEALDVMLVHLSYRLQLTDTQKPLFDAFRTKALTEETSFADQCKTAMPDTTSGKPDLLDGIKAHLTIQQNELTALNDLLPDFETLYSSLTDQQKQAITPRHGMMGGMGMGRFGRNGDMGRSDVGRGDVGRGDVGRSDVGRGDAPVDPNHT